MTFPFNMCKSLYRFLSLLQEYDLAIDVSSRAEQLTKQRSRLKKRYGDAGLGYPVQTCYVPRLVLLPRLGLDSQMKDLLNTEDMISDADFLPAAQASSKLAGKDAPDLLSNMSGTCQPEMPAHEVYLPSAAGTHLIFTQQTADVASAQASALLHCIAACTASICLGLAPQA